MRKENGRLKPADPKELAGLKAKTYGCWKCGYTQVVRNPEFGEARCPKCFKGTLVEQTPGGGE